MFILIFLLFLEATTPCVYATDTETYFARVMFEQVYLYKFRGKIPDIIGNAKPSL